MRRRGPDEGPRGDRGPPAAMTRGRDVSSGPIYPVCMIRMHPAAADHAPPGREPTVDTTLTAPATDQPWVNPRDPALALGPDGRPPGAAAHRSGRMSPTSSGTTGAGSSRHRVNSLEEIEQVLNLTDEERDGSVRPGQVPGGHHALLPQPHRPRRPERPHPPPGHPARPGAAGVHGDDGGLARRGPPLAGAGAGPPLPRPGADAHHHPVRELLPVLHAVADRRATPRRTSTARSTRRSSSTCAGRPRCATCSSAAATA